MRQSTTKSIAKLYLMFGGSPEMYADACAEYGFLPPERDTNGRVCVLKRNRSSVYMTYHVRSDRDYYEVASLMKEQGILPIHLKAVLLAPVHDYILVVDEEYNEMQEHGRHTYYDDYSWWNVYQYVRKEQNWCDYELGDLFF